MAKDLLTDKRSDLGTVMRGLAIVGIFMHNWLHCIGFAAENEFGFTAQNCDIFLQSVRQSSFTHAIGDIISFYGWIGVCVFIFLSGYGLEKKYHTENVAIGSFVWKQWKKLFILMLPGTLFFVIFGCECSCWKPLLSLTLLGNLMYEWPLPVGVYWYFGLAFELYLLWLLVWKLDIKWLIVIAIAFMAFQLSMIGVGDMYYIKHNFFGWGQLFIGGMIAARYSSKMPQLNTWQTALIALASIVLVVYTSLYLVPWMIFLPFMAVIAVWSLSQLVVRCRIVKRVALWLGMMSSFIFACHPVIRFYVCKEPISIFNILIQCVIYISCTMLLSVAFGWLMKKVRRWVK